MKEVKRCDIVSSKEDWRGAKPWVRKRPPFEHDLDLFCKNAKNRHIAKNDDTNVCRSMWWPLRGVRRAARTRTLAPTLYAKSSTMRRRFVIFSSDFVGSTKIDTSYRELRTLVARHNAPSNPSSTAHGNKHAPPSPVCKAQHYATPFRHRFGLFRREPKKLIVAERPNEMPTTKREALHSNIPCGCPCGCSNCEPPHGRTASALNNHFLH